MFKPGVKKSGDIDSRIHQFLLYYRSIPQSTTGVSPSMLMFNRQIRTRVDLMLHEKHNEVIMKQSNIVGRGSKGNRFLYNGDHVMILNCAKNSKQKKSLDGCIVNKNDLLTYTIALQMVVYLEGTLI